MSSPKVKLDPNFYLLAAEYIGSGECFGVYYAMHRAAYRLNDFQLPDLVPYISAWKREFEIVSNKDLICNDRGWTQQRKIDSLLRMAYLAEKEDENRI